MAYCKLRTPLVAPFELLYWIPRRNSLFSKWISYEDVKMIFPNWFCNWYVTTMLITYKTLRSNIFYRGFLCCHDIPIFFVYLLAKKYSFHLCCSPSVFTHFNYFCCFTLLQHEFFKFNFSLNFNTFSLFHLKVH